MKRAAGMIAAAAFALAGCGGDDSGAGGGTGASMPAAAFAVAFTSPGPECPVSSHDAALGSISTTEKHEVVVDGEDGASIDCRVSGSGTFAVQATAVSPSTAVALSLDISTISPAAAVDNPALGSVTFSSPSTGGEPASSGATPCEFYFVPDGGGGVDKGKIWVAFRCPEITIDVGQCSIDASVALFENCTL